MELDDLQIKIKADASNANKSIDKLAESMKNLASSLSIDTQRLSNIATGIKNISDAATGFKGGKSTEISSLAKSLGNLSKVDTNSLYGIGTAMKNLANSISGTQNINVSGISNIALSLSKLGGIKATAGSQNLIKMKDDLVNFIQGMNNIGSLNFDVNSLASLITSVRKLGTTTGTRASVNLSPISAQLQNFVRQMNGIGALNFDMTNMTQLVSAISRLGSVASGRAVANIPLLATNLKGLFNTLSTAPAVSSNIIQMTEALAKLASTGSKTGTAANSLTRELFSFGKSASTAKVHSFSLASAIGKVYASYWLLFRAFSKFKSAIDISSSLTEVQNVVRQVFGQYEDAINSMAKSSIQALGMSELSVKQYASRFQAMGTAMGVATDSIGKANEFLANKTNGYIKTADSMASVSMNLTRLTADLASFYDVAQEDVAKDLESIFTGQTRPLRAYGLDITQATLKEWALKNGLDANISSMTQAQKAMLRYQYVLANTTAAQGDFARTADTWHNQVTVLKESFQQLGGIIGGALINAFKPYLKALNYALQKTIYFSEMVTNALGAIFGWKYEVTDKGMVDDWSDMADSADDIADSTGKAAKNNMKSVRAFDELKTITKNTQGSKKSSGAGTGTTDTSGSSGKFVQVDTIFKDYESNIKSLYELGSKIGSTIYTSLNDINWESIYQKATGFGEGLANFLNGLISPELFGAVGRTVARSLNTAIYSALSFGETFDFKNLGKSIASGINNFFHTFDFIKLAQTLNVWAAGIKDTVETAIKEIEWEDVLDKIGDFFGEINLDTVEVIVGTVLIKNALKAVFTQGALKAVSKQFGQKLASVFGVEIGKNAGVGSALGAGLLKALKIGVGGLKIDASVLFGAGTATEIGATLATGIAAAFVAAVGGWNFGQLIAGKLSDSAKQVVDEMSFFEQMKYIGDWVAEGVNNSLTSFAVWVGEVNGTKQAWDLLRQSTKAAFDQETWGEGFNNVINALTTTRASIDNLVTSANNYVNNAGAAEAQLAQDLANKYYELADKENLTNEEKDQMRSYAEQLAEIIPGVNDVIDSETGCITAQKDEIEALIQKELEHIKLQAMKDKLVELYKQQADAADDLTEAQNRVATASEAVKKAQEDYDNSLTLHKNNLGEYYLAGDKEAQQLKTAQEEYEKLKGELTNTDVAYNRLGTTIRNFEGKITDSMSSMYSSGESGGANVVEGLNNGIEDGIDSSAETTSSWVEDGVVDPMYEGLDEHSPSKISYSAGEYFVEGFNNAVSDSTGDTVSTITGFVDTVVSNFDTLADKLYDIGTNAMQGLLNGMGGMENDLYNKADDIANNITDTVKKALDIHSPSKVMYELGGYTIEGFKDGMESLYNQTLASVKDFSADITIAPAPSIQKFYSDSINPVNVDRYNNAQPYTAPQQSNSETNTLLRRLISAVESGQSIQIDGQEVFKSVKKQADDFTNRTGEPAFGF